MKGRVKKKQQKRYEYKNYKTMIVYEVPIVLKKRKKAILRAHGVKPWMLNRVMIRYSFCHSWDDLGICWSPWLKW